MLKKYFFLSLLFLFFPTNFAVKYTREQQMKEQFDDFLKIHNKHYSTNDKYQYHFNIFHKNLQRINHYHDENGNLCKMYLTRYSDLTTDTKYDYDTCKKNLYLKK